MLLSFGAVRWHAGPRRPASLWLVPRLERDIHTGAPSPLPQHLRTAV